MEEWKTIQSHADYEASNHGRIRRRVPTRNARGPQLPAGTILKGSRASHGYRQVRLSDGNGHAVDCLVHRLVLEAFYGVPFVGAVGCHINGDTADNQLSNLKWGTQSENVRGSRKPIIARGIVNR